MGPPIGDGGSDGGENPQDGKKPEIRDEGEREMEKKDRKPSRSELKDRKTRTPPPSGEGEINKPEKPESADLFSEDEEKKPAQRQRKGGAQ